MTVLSPEIWGLLGDNILFHPKLFAQNKITDDLLLSPPPLPTN